VCACLLKAKMQGKTAAGLERDQKSGLKKVEPDYHKTGYVIHACWQAQRA